MTLFGKQCLLQYLSLAIQICLLPHYNHFSSNPSRKLFVNSNHHLWLYRIMAGLICDQGRLHPMSLTLVFHSLSKLSKYWENHPMSLTLVFTFLFKTFKILRKCSRWLLLLPVDRPSSWQCKWDFLDFFSNNSKWHNLYQTQKAFCTKRF